MASKFLILCLLPFFFAVAEKVKNAHGHGKHGHVKHAKDEHHATRQELKKMLEGKSPQEIAALRKKVDAAKAKAPAPVSSASAPVSEKDKDLADLKHQVELLKHQVEDKVSHKKEESSTKKDPTRPGHHEGHAPAPSSSHAVDAKGKAASHAHQMTKKEVVHDLQEDMDRMMSEIHAAGEGAHQRSNAEMVLIPGDDDFVMQLDGTMASKAGLEREHIASKRHPAYQALSTADYNKQFAEYAEPKDDSSWLLYLGVGVVALLGYLAWNGQLGGRNGDMFSVTVPGLGDVNAEKLFDRTTDIYAKGGKLDSEEYSDLVDAGYTSYGAGTMKPMKNVATSWVVGAPPLRSASHGGDGDDFGL